MYVLFMMIGICLLSASPYIFAKMKPEYKPLSGVHIVLDAGHGGRDDGAQAGSVKEQGINLKIVQRLKVYLEEVGCKVTLTRDGDYDLAQEGAKNRKRSDMEKRVELINQQEVDAFLSIHLNSFSNTSAKGAQTFYKKDAESSKVLGDLVQSHFKKLNGTAMTSKPGDYYILNNSNKVGVLVECGFLSNASDRAKLITEAYQDDIAKSLFDSVVEYFAMLN